MKEKQLNRDHWNDKLNIYLSGCFWDNLTDFNYSTCHTYFLASDNNRFAIGSRELNAFLSAGNAAYYVKLQISCKAPLVCIAFCKYDRAPTAFRASREAYTTAQQEIYRKLEKFAKDNNLQIFHYDDISYAEYQEYFEIEA